MVKKLLWALGILAVLGALVLGAALFLFNRGPDLKPFEYLRTPHIRSLPSQKMLVVEMKGDPNKAGGQAIAQLYRAYYQLPGINKAVPVAPRARWPKPLDTPKDDWIGIFGLPVPEAVMDLPAGKPGRGPEVKLAVWDYGEVAEILHVGPYSAEAPTVEKLKAFILDQGYEMIGDHEEEYLKGPGMFFKGDPQGYYTIIRYRIEKQPPAITQPDDPKVRSLSR